MLEGMSTFDDTGEPSAKREKPDDETEVSEAEMKKEGKQASEGETGANEQVSAVTGLTAIGKQSRR